MKWKFFIKNCRKIRIYKHRHLANTPSSSLLYVRSLRMAPYMKFYKKFASINIYVGIMRILLQFARLIFKVVLLKIMNILKLVELMNFLLEIILLRRLRPKPHTIFLVKSIRVRNFRIYMQIHNSSFVTWCQKIQKN